MANNGTKSNQAVFHEQISLDSIWYRKKWLIMELNQIKLCFMNKSVSNYLPDTAHTANALYLRTRTRHIQGVDLASYRANT